MFKITTLSSVIVGLLVVSLLSVNQSFAQTSGGSGSITSLSPSSCSSFPCTVSVSWNITSNPDGDEVTMSYGAGISPAISNPLALSGSLSNLSVSAPANFLLFVGGVQVDAKSITLATPAPSPTPAPLTCNQDCTSGGTSCVSGLSCINNKCRLPSYPDRSDCTAPSYPDYRTCNQSCGSGNQQCVSGLTCHNGFCRLPSNTGDTGCHSPSGSSSSTSTTPAAATPAPSRITTGTTRTSQTLASAASPSPSASPVDPLVLGVEAEAVPSSLPSPISQDSAPEMSFTEDLLANPLKAIVVLGSIMGVTVFAFAFYKYSGFF